jgi:hypothetical protein
VKPWPTLAEGHPASCAAESWVHFMVTGSNECRSPRESAESRGSVGGCKGGVQRPQACRLLSSEQRQMDFQAGMERTGPALPPHLQTSKIPNPNNPSHWPTTTFHLTDVVTSASNGGASPVGCWSACESGILWTRAASGRQRTWTQPPLRLRRRQRASAPSPSSAAWTSAVRQARRATPGPGARCARFAGVASCSTTSNLIQPCFPHTLHGILEQAHGRPVPAQHYVHMVDVVLLVCLFNISAVAVVFIVKSLRYVSSNLYPKFGPKSLRRKRFHRQSMLISFKMSCPSARRSRHSTARVAASRRAK